MDQPRVDFGAHHARTGIQDTLGLPVELLDDGTRQGVCDLRYVSNGITVVVEVKQMFDPAYRALQREVGRVGYTRDARLTRLWDVRLQHTARFKDARRLVPDLLIQAESLGLERIPADLRRPAPGSIEDAFDRLRISAVSMPPTEKTPPGFDLMLEGWGGAVPGVESLPEFCAQTLRGEAMARLREQLARADADERHAFLILGWERMEAMSLDADDDGELPTDSPNLPGGIDGVWLTSTASSARVLAWLPDRGWIEGRRS